MGTLIGVYYDSGEKKYIEIEKLDIVFFVAGGALLFIFTAFSVIALMR